MAHIIGDDYGDPFIGTELEFTDGDKDLKAFFAKTRRDPNTILKATWFTGTPILPEVVPTRARIIEGNALYDWRTVHGGPTLVSARFEDCVEELDPGRHGFFPLIVEDRNGVVEAWPLFPVQRGRMHRLHYRGAKQLQRSRPRSGRSMGIRARPWPLEMHAGCLGDRRPGLLDGTPV